MANHTPSSSSAPSRGFSLLSLINNERLFSRRWLATWAMILADR